MLDQHTTHKLRELRKTLTKPKPPLHDGVDQKCALSRPRFLPGSRLSGELVKCHHRARVEANTRGWPPRRARCTLCRRWRNTIPSSARRPIPNATRTIVAERVEERDGRLFSVRVLATPRRARARLADKPATEPKGAR